MDRLQEECNDLRREKSDYRKKTEEAMDKMAELETTVFSCIKQQNQFKLIANIFVFCHFCKFQNFRYGAANKIFLYAVSCFYIFYVFYIFIFVVIY